MLSKRLEHLRADLADRDIESLVVSDILNVRYLTGFTGSFAAAVVTADQSILVTDSRYTDQAGHEAPGWELEILQGGLIATLGRVVEHLHLGRIGFEEHNLTYGTWSLLHAALPDAELLTAGNPLGKQRMIKDEGEIAAIRRAAVLTDAAFSHVYPLLKPGVSERELSVELDCFMRREGADKEAFDPVITSGPRTALVHGRATDRHISANDFLLLDFGARLDGYHADITRTVIIGAPDAKQREVWKVVLEAQQRAIAAIKPGVTGGAIDAIARDCIKNKGYCEYFGHGLGHGLGLSVHDDRVLAQASEIVLQEDMVFTVEPGIYITGWGGVRIEDDVLVTATGVEILTHSPKTLRIG